MMFLNVKSCCHNYMEIGSGSQDQHMKGSLTRGFCFEQCECRWMNGTVPMVSMGLDTTGRYRDTTGLESGHNRASAQWDWDMVGQGHNGTGTGTQLDFYALGLGHCGTGTKRDWNRDTTGFLLIGTGTQQDRGITGTAPISTQLTSFMGSPAPHVTREVVW